MKLPWNRKQKIQELKKENQRLQEKIKELEEERDSFRNRFQAEKERRSKLSKEKQEAEEKLNKLEQKVQSQEKIQDSSADVEDQDIEKLSLEQVKRILNKLQSIESSEKDLLTVYSPENIQELSDQQGLKSSV